MFLNFVKNARHFGHTVLIYSWAIGMISAVLYMLLDPSIIGALIIGTFMTLKLAFIGFIIRFVADMFLVERD